MQETKTSQQHDIYEYSIPPKMKESMRLKYSNAENRRRQKRKRSSLHQAKALGQVLRFSFLSSFYYC